MNGKFTNEGALAMIDNTVVVEKSANMHKEGVKALLSGDIEPFKGRESLVQSIQDRYIVAGMVQGGWQLLQKLDLLASPEQLNIGFFRAGREFPIHFTVGECRVPPENQQEVFSRLAKDPELARLGAGAEGLELVFDTLVLDKANVLLTASNIPPWVPVLRDHLSVIYDRCGGMSLKIENLLHITLARIMSIPGDRGGWRNVLGRYVAEMSLLRGYVQANPIRERVGVIVRMPSVGLFAMK